MLVIETVEDLPSLFASADDALQSQPAQLVGNSRFAHAKLFSNSAYALFAVEQQLDNAHTRRIAQGAEQISQVEGNVFV
jgi:hypothetical protein